MQVADENEGIRVNSAISIVLVQQDQKSNVMLTQVQSDAMVEMIVVLGARGLVVIVAHVGLFLDARCQRQQPRQ